ncbi:hypothetical protein [Corynebacterium meridianum]|uniref:Uncharacterized protein n=1 Tax=Corynebacterium meridianum TaxID=2765363 RepID=A0A934I100_9CORY|nr:hypothetical protein [Corynebacterium meridianum]MBI8990252.1 hypothetical protein [Corynebacterium meridianum]
MDEKQYSSGWERIETVRASAAQARMSAELDRELLSADDVTNDLINDGAGAMDRSWTRHS